MSFSRIGQVKRNEFLVHVKVFGGICATNVFVCSFTLQF